MLIPNVSLSRVSRTICILDCGLFLSRVSMTVQYSLHYTCIAECNIDVANPSVCPSIIVSKRMHISSRLHHLIRAWPSFFECYHRYEIPQGTPSAEALHSRRGEFAVFDWNRYLCGKRYGIGPWPTFNTVLICINCLFTVNGTEWP